MSGRQATYTALEIIDLLDENYGIPFDGGLSDISSEHSERDIGDEDADFDIETTASGENSEVLDNLHAAEIVEEEETEICNVYELYV